MKEHEAIADLIESLDLIGYTVGKVFEQVESNAFLHQFETTEGLNLFLERENITEKLILLKGSRSIGLERAEGML